MLDDMAVVNRNPAEVAGGYGDAYGIFFPDVDHIFPGSVGLGPAIDRQHLEGIGVQVEGVIHVGLVDQFPYF